MPRVVCLTLLLCLLCRVAQADSALPVRSKYLVLDSRVVEATEGVKLAVGRVAKHPANPLFAEEHPWEVRFDNLYANIIHDKEDGLFKCWYSPFVMAKPEEITPREKRIPGTFLKVVRSIKGEKWQMAVCYAESTDGIKWIKPLMDIREWQGQKSNILDIAPHGAGVFKDHREKDPRRRYKMFYREGKEPPAVAFSADGLHWTEYHMCPEVDAPADTHNNAFWAPELNKYVGITRLWSGPGRWGGQRVVGRTESADFIRWTKAVEVFRGDAVRQIYAMAVFRYADIYLGLVMVFNTDEDRVHCELAASPDTIHWYRIDLGTPLIGNSQRRGDYDWGCVYAAATPIMLDDEIRLYYGACNGPHTDWRDGFLALATLRPDGFAGYESTQADTPGMLLAKPVVCSGNHLLVSADAEGGQVRVAVTDTAGHELIQCEPISADVTGYAVGFKGGADLSEFRGKPIRLRFHLNCSKLYAFGFSD